MDILIPYSDHTPQTGHPAPKLFPSTRTTTPEKEALRDELQAVLNEDFAVDDEELAADVYAIAASVRKEARDVVAALDLSADASMISLEALVDALGPHLVSTADRISARLGYRRDDEKN